MLQTMGEFPPYDIQIGVLINFRFFFFFYILGHNTIYTSLMVLVFPGPMAVESFPVKAQVIWPSLCHGMKRISEEGEKKEENRM